MCQNEMSIKADLENEDSLSSLETERQKDFPIKSTYIIKYTRKKNELSQLIHDTNLPKAKHCLFMVELIIIKNNDENNESLLHIKCHEIAAIHFEDYYERIYSYNDILKENKYFKALDSIEDIKEIIDYVLSQNFNNSQKIFIQLEKDILKLHIMLTYFDTIKEIILNIPRKVLKEKEKIFLLPMALKEMQTKMNFYEIENKKYKHRQNRIEGKDNFNNNFYEFYLKLKYEKEKVMENEKENEEEITKNETYDTSNNSITSDEKKIKKNGKMKKKKKKRNKSEPKRKNSEKQDDNDENEVTNCFS